MQCKFLIAFVLMGACLIQATSSQPIFIMGGGLGGGIGGGAGGGVGGGVGGGLGHTIGNILEDAHKTLEGAIGFVQQQVEAALKNIHELQQKVTQQKAQVIEEMKQELQIIIEEALRSIEEFQKKAVNASIDISSCIKGNEGKFQEVFDQFLANEVQCVTKEVDEAMRIINESIHIITNTIDTLKDIPNELFNCASDGLTLLCVNKVIEHAFQMQKDLPRQIVVKVQEVTDLVGGLKTRLGMCATSQLANAGIANGGIVAEIAQCVTDKGVK